MKINQENITINKENIKELENLYVHDFYVTDFNYNINLEKISINFISDRSEFKDIEIIFSNVVFFKYNNTYFLNNDKTANDLYFDKEYKCYKILENEYNEFKKISGFDSLYLERLNKDDLLDIVIQFISGNEFSILCKNIDIIYFNNNVV